MATAYSSNNHYNPQASSSFMSGPMSAPDASYGSSNSVAGHYPGSNGAPQDSYEVRQLSQSLDQAIGELPPSATSSARSPPRGASRAPGDGPGSSQDMSDSTYEQPRPLPAPASRNPLVDLIDTERGYIEDLALVIKVGLPGVCSLGCKLLTITFCYIASCSSLVANQLPPSCTGSDVPSDRRRVSDRQAVHGEA